MDELNDALNDAINELTRARDELAADPRLATNWHWRDNLETTAYQVMSSLSSEE